MTRAAALIVQDGRVALIQRQRGDELIYVFPGGKVESGELPEEAAVREVREQLDLNVRVERLVAHVVLEGADQFYYLVCITGGEYGTDNCPEMCNDQAGARSDLPVWLPCRALSTLPVIPRAVALLVEFSGNGWPHHVLRLGDRGRERRAVVPVA